MSAMSWLSRGEMVALGWTLLHFCWQGTAVAVVFAVMDRMTSRATPAVRYLVALIALALMPLVVVATFAEEMRIATSTSANGSTMEAISTANVLGLQKPVLRDIPLTLAPAVEERGAWLAARAEHVLPWVDGLWMLGVLMLAMRAMGGWWQLEHLRRRARGMVPEELERAFKRISDQVRAGRQVTLRVSSEVISPFAMGVWRATVILPVSTVLGLPMEELEAVLAHELGHVRRWDCVWNLLQIAVESVLFFHPSVWWLSRTVRERREVCCDEIAVKSCAGAAVYARALLRLEEQRTVELRLAMALEGCRGSLLERVKQVLGEDMAMESRMTSGVRVAAAGAVMIALLLGPKVGEAVAAPMVTVSRPVIAHVLASFPQMAPSPTVKAKAQVVNVQVTAPAAAAVPQANLKMDLSEPMPQVHVNPSVSTAVAMNIVMPSVPANPQATEGTAQPKGLAYLDGMRAAGYPMDLDNDLNALVSLKSLGVTPEYAKSMGAVGLGKPTTHDLIDLKSTGVPPEYVAELKQSGLELKDFHEAVMLKLLAITPEYAAAMKQKGFGDLKVHQLISLKAQGMTPEYAGWLKQQFPQATMEELGSAATFHIDEKFLSQATAHGFDGKDLHKLLRLKMSGLLDE
jgi:beta-lactamase regulating signal transducer with metallopeptidase domain